MDTQSIRGSTGQLSSGSIVNETGGMHHSLSTPAGVDCGGSNRTPPPTPKKGGKMLAIRVQMLDDTVTIIQIQAKAIGKVLFDQVCKQLHLLEADYFGLEYTDIGGTRYWLDLQKPLSRQLGLSLVDPLLYFCVKFYTPDPGQLEEEFTRYLFCLQVKRDLSQGVMQCNENTAALMASYIVQAECGDYVSEDYPDHTYLSTYKFIPSQDHDMERRIMENHKKHSGQSPAIADLNLLETARRCEFYGIKMHPSKDHENIPLNLAVAHMGILVFQNYTKINTFSWAKIRKISFKRKRFLIKLHPEGYGFYKDTVEFFFEGRNECKNFWKKCVENHGFFRCPTVKHISRHKTRVLSRGSSFRYSGKTQKQIIEFVRDNYVKRQTFQRSASFRHSSAHSSASNMHSTTVGNSISAHPLLPLSDTKLSVEAAKLSASLDSMSKSVEPQVSRTTRSVSRPHVTPTILNSDQVTRTGIPKEPIVIRPPALPKMTNSPSPPLTTQSPTPPTSATISPIKRTDIAEQEITAMDARNLHYTSPPPDDHEVAAHKADTDDEKLENISSIEQNMRNDDSSVYNKFSYLTSTPNHHHTTNGNISDSSINTTNGDYEIMKMNNVSPIKNFKEQLLNNINASNKSNGYNTTTIIAEIEGEVKRKHRFVDKGYYMAKEILMTEITYKKDLDVINVWFRNNIDTNNDIPQVCISLLDLIKPLAEAHEQLLKDLELRIQGWDGKGGPKATQGKIADVLLTHLPPLIPLYQEYIDEHINVLQQLDAVFKQNLKFEQMYRAFETQKVCYLPFTFFVLRPLHRLMQYRAMINRLLKHYGVNHPDRTDSVTVANCLKAIIDPVPEILEESENISVLCELEKDLLGFDNLFQPYRKFIRHGCLLKLSKKGYQQRMFFLFSDVLLYTSRCQATFQFNVHGHLSLKSLSIEEPEGELAYYGFTICSIENNKFITVAANSYEEMEQWKTDLKKAIQASQQDENMNENKIPYTGLVNDVEGSTDNLLDECGNNVGTQTKLLTQRSNTTVHVCWHRNTSLTVNDKLLSVENQLSGYLLRKFKKSNGWQKLWVVFTNFCLFFYKGCKDEFPLASLPLLGYTIQPPAVEDEINKDFVFKLQYKNHIYFFRAESEYTYNRWMEVINYTTQNKIKKKFQQLENENSIERSLEK